MLLALIVVFFRIPLRWLFLGECLLHERFCACCLKFPVSRPKLFYCIIEEGRMNICDSMLIQYINLEPGDTVSEKVGCEQAREYLQQLPIYVY